MPGPYTALFLDPRGPGDARPTAMQIIKDQNLEGKLSDKTFLVTGTSSGIGVETVRAVAATGATVYATARDMNKAQKALHGVLRPGKVELIHMENESLASVREAAAELLRRSGGKLNVLVANAGVMMPPAKEMSADGHEIQFAVNHLAHFLLFQLVKDAMLMSSTPEFNSRVVMVSSVGHQWSQVHWDDFNYDDGSYTPMGSYGQSKTANVYMANHIERLYGAKGLHGLSVHPGSIETGIQRYVPKADMLAWTSNAPVMRYTYSTPQGAATSITAAVGKEWEGKGGKYLEGSEEAVPQDKFAGPMGGVAAHAFDPAGEERLWRETLTLLSL